jgi:hypothetical protein
MEAGSKKIRRYNTGYRMGRLGRMRGGGYKGNGYVRRGDRGGKK